MLTLLLLSGELAFGATNVQIADSGRSFSSTLVRCHANPDTGDLAPAVIVGLFNPKPIARADVTLNGSIIGTLTADDNRRIEVWLKENENVISVDFPKGKSDLYTFDAPPDVCALPEPIGNRFSADGLTEYAASEKSYATVNTSCAFNPKTGSDQSYINLFVSGNFLLNVSLNGIPLTQLGPRRPNTHIFLDPGRNVISAANGFLTVDHYIRDDEACQIP